LFDDIAVIARATAASIDDVAVAAGRASTKAAGVVIDDAAVTPGYVTGLDPARELPIIGKIALGSLKNKLLILLPGALLLSEFLPQAIIYLLILGGAFLCYEGAEKVMEKLGGAKHGKTLGDAIEDPVEFENQRVKGAIRTDMILSAEIMAIVLNEVAAETLANRAIILALVGIAITIAVYGVVALIVKMDDVGLHLAQRGNAGARALGRGMVAAMPRILTVLSVVGTVAMLWVGGGIILHGMHELGVDALYKYAHDLEHAAEVAGGGVLGWATFAGLSALFGLILGALIAFLAHKVFKLGHGSDGEGAAAH
jgi:predicted DNA repair protein MutK